MVAGIRLEVRIGINLGHHQCRVVADGLSDNFWRGPRQAVEIHEILAGSPIDPEIGDPEPAQVLGHRRWSACDAHEDVSRSVVALRDHHLEQVRHRELDPGVGECLGKRKYADDHHVERDFDQLAETEFAPVHAIQHGSGDRNLVGAGHGEGLITIERDDLVAADFLRSKSYAPGKSCHDPLNRRSYGLSFSCLAVCGAEGRHGRNCEGNDKMTIFHIPLFFL